MIDGSMDVLLRALVESNSTEKINHQFTKICENFSVNQFAIGRIFDLGNQEKRMESFDTCPHGWMSHYISNQYYMYDKMLEWKNIKLPFSCTIDSLLKTTNPIQKRLYQDAIDFGIRQGTVIPQLSSHNEQRFLGILGVVPCPEVVQVLSVSCQLYWDTKRKLESRHVLSQFTSRELEVLFLKSQGMPIKVLADRLAISDSTVVFHLKNARNKLKATSIDHALYLFGRIMEQAQRSDLKKSDLRGRLQI